MVERHILIIDDEPVLTRLLDYNLSKHGFRVRSAHTGREGLAIVEQESFDGVILLDLRLPDENGLELVEPLIGANPTNRIIMMTAHGSIDAAVEATRKGAYDFLSKTDDLTGRLVVAVKNAFRDREMTQRVSTYEDEVAGRGAFAQFVARSPQMRRVFDITAHTLDSRVTVLVTGESGTGKELVARALHLGGPRRAGPFVAVNCAGIPDSLLESELFGHERGAFTGAVAAKKGKFEAADGGTLFLDEIGEMPMHLQAKLLRVLQDRRIERLGGNQQREVDVRIISATHRNLNKMVEEGTLREDLFYRLSVFPIHLPPLREREGDVPLLADHFLRKYAAEEGKPITGIAPLAMRTLELHQYPGNVRELENIISRGVVVANGPRLTLTDLPIEVVEATRHLRLVRDRAGPDDLSADTSLERAFELLFQSPEELPALEKVETELLRRALRLCEGNVVAAAKALGMSRATIYRRLERLGGKDFIEPGSSE